MFQFETSAGMKNAGVSMTEKNRKFHFHIFSLAFFPNLLKNILAIIILKPTMQMRATTSLKPT